MSSVKLLNQKENLRCNLLCMSGTINKVTMNVISKEHFFFQKSQDTRFVHAKE